MNSANRAPPGCPQLAPCQGLSQEGDGRQREEEALFPTAFFCALVPGGASGPSAFGTSWNPSQLRGPRPRAISGLSPEACVSASWRRLLKLQQEPGHPTRPRRVSSQSAGASPLSSGFRSPNFPPNLSDNSYFLQLLFGAILEMPFFILFAF